MSENFVIPVAAARHNLIALGKTRAGKSSKLRVLVEYLLEGGSPVCIIDPKGDWWGLKSSADGKRAGFPIVIFGGEHADVPINEHSGAQVAEIIATGNRPALIDLGGWMVGQRTRFFVDFAATFFKLARGARHLVIDEVHNFAPQGRIMDPDAGKMLHWANRLASEGSGKGITIFAASQRPQKVHKDFVTSCETLIACKVIHKLDRDAIKDWIDGCADASKGREVIADLAQLKKPEAWAWCPEVDYGPERVTFPMFGTYDSFKPQPADLGKLKGWADVDLEDVKAKLATVVQEAEANDPRKLKAEIARLTKLLDTRTLEVKDDPATQARIATLEQDNLALGLHRDALAEHNNALVNTFERLKHALEQIDGKLHEGAAAIGDARAAIGLLPQAPRPSTIQFPKPSAPAPTAARISETRPPVARAASTSAPRSSKANGHDSSLTKGQRVVLTAIAQSGEADPEQLTVLTGYKKSSRDTYLQQLRSAGYATAGWPVQATAEGIAALGDFEPLPTGAALRKHWLNELGGGEQRILEVLIEAYPNGRTRDEITKATDYLKSSRDTYLQKLGARKLVEKRGSEVFASERLF